MYDLAKQLCQPYLWLMIALAAAILAARRREVSKWIIGTMAFCWLSIFTLSVPLVAYLLIGTLEWHYPPPDQLPPDADAIITLGGGINPPTKYRDTAEVTGSSYGRCLHTIGLYRQLDRPTVILCGGKTDGEAFPSEASVMREMLVKFDVSESDIVLEERSKSTFENARNAKQRLEELGRQKPLLVTAGRHMLRSALCFRKLGVNVVPVPSSYKSDGIEEPYYKMLIPHPDSLATSHDAIREWVALAYYRVRGRV